MPRRHFIWILITVAMGAALLVVWHRPAPGPSPDDDSFRSVQTAYELIRDAHYQEPDEQVLRQGAVRGMVETLDPFSLYMPPGQAELLSDRIFGAVRGIGVRLNFGDRQGLGPVPVLGVLPNSPAAQADILPADLLLAIDETPVTGLSQDRVEQLLDTGDEPVELTLHREDSQTAIRRVTLRPQQFDVHTVQGLTLTPAGQWNHRLPDHDDIRYVRIGEFCPQTPQRMQRFLRKIGRPTRGLVLDLRGNPGGLLEDGIAVAELFLDSGEIVTVTGRNNGPRVYNAHDDSPWGDLPLVVLIDGDTASAGELLAGAMAANARAILLGTRTHGKGCVQSMFRLPDDLGQINLTTKEFRVVPDRPIQRTPTGDTWGVDPHVRQPLADVQAATLRQLRQQAELLPAENSEAADRSPSSGEDADPLARRLLQADPQLQRALELLADEEEYRRRIEIIAADVQRARQLRERRQAQQENEDDD